MDSTYEIIVAGNANPQTNIFENLYKNINTESGAAYKFIVFFTQALFYVIFIGTTSAYCSDTPHLSEIYLYAGAYFSIILFDIIWVICLLFVFKNDEYFHRIYVICHFIRLILQCILILYGIVILTINSTHSCRKVNAFMICLFVFNAMDYILNIFVSYKALVKISDLLW